MGRVERRGRVAGPRLLLTTGLLLGSGWPSPSAFAGTQDVLRVYIARHGETDWNRQGRLQGQVDTELNERGREQAAVLASRLKGVALSQVYSSTLRRSIETAEMARGATPLLRVEALREQDLGIYEDLCLDGSEPLREAAWRRRGTDGPAADDGVEEESDLFARVRAFATELRQRHGPGENVLVVGHYGSNRMLVRALLGLDPAQAAGIRQANDDVFLVELGPGKLPELWSLVDPSKLGGR